MKKRFFLGIITLLIGMVPVSAQHNIKHQTGYTTYVKKINGTPITDSAATSRDPSYILSYSKDGELIGEWRKVYDENGQVSGIDSIAFRNRHVAFQTNGKLSTTNFWNGDRLIKVIYIEDRDTQFTEHYDRIRSDSAGATDVVRVVYNGFQRIDTLYVQYTDSSVLTKRVYGNPNGRMVNYLEQSYHPSGLLTGYRSLFHGPNLNLANSGYTVRMDDGRPIRHEAYENGELVKVTHHHYKNDLEVYRVEQYINYGYRVRIDFEYVFWD